MTDNALNPFARALAWSVGVLDLGAGLTLALVPWAALSWIGIELPGADAGVFLRWVGVFVAAVGAAYLRAASGSPERLRMGIEFTLWFRGATGLFSAWAIARGWLGMGWLAVPLVNLGLTGAQWWLLARGRASA